MTPRRQAIAGADLSWNWTTYNTITSVESNPSNSAAIKLSGELSPNLLLEASMNYDGNIINITNSPNVLSAERLDHRIPSSRTRVRTNTPA